MTHAYHPRATPLPHTPTTPIPHPYHTPNTTPTHPQPQPPPLGAWQEKQRLFYRKGQLSASRVERLESIGVVWDGRREALNASRASQHNAKAAVCRSGTGAGAGANRTWRHRHLAEMPRATSPRHAPRSPEGGLVAAWHQEWRERVGCWWLALPLAAQTRLGECLGAVSFHLGSRLDALLGQRRDTLHTTPLHTTPLHTTPLHTTPLHLPPPPA